MNDENSTQQIKKYTFYTNAQTSNSNSKEELEILIPEVTFSVLYIQLVAYTTRVYIFLTSR